LGDTEEALSGWEQAYTAAMAREDAERAGISAEAAVGLAAALFVSNMYLAGRLRPIEEVLNGALDREDHRAR
jgi:hypothetical protein